MSADRVSVTFRMARVGRDYIDRLVDEFKGRDRTAILAAMLTVAARHEDEVRAQVAADRTAARARRRPREPFSVADL